MRVAFLAMAAVVLVLVVLLAANIARHALSPQSTTKVHVLQLAGCLGNGADPRDARHQR